MFGMQVMTTALQRVAGQQLRELLYRVTKNRLIGLAVGALVAVFMHSAGTTVMLIGFVNAGLVTLAESIGVMLGANIGTTFAMQIVAFQIGKFCHIGIVVGFLLYLFSRRFVLKYVGYGILGFGLLFLGLDTMSGAIAPLKELGYFQGMLAVVNVGEWYGFGAAIGIAIVVSAVIQSGATIGILFALSIGGVFRDFGQVFPFILGAHIGTCATVLLGSIGGDRVAKRTALSHVLFNVLGSLVAIVMYPVYLWVIPSLAGDLARQIANGHTLIQLVNGLLFLPFTTQFADVLGRIIPQKKGEQRTFLSAQYLDTPEMAVVAIIKEIRRMAVYTVRMLRIAMEGIVRMDVSRYYEVSICEDIVDTLKNAINTYIMQLTERKLSRRQSMLVQYLMSTVADLERIGDHIDTMVSMTKERFHRDVWFDWESMQDLFQLYQFVHKILSMVVRSLDPKQQRFAESAGRIMELRDDYVRRSIEVKKKYQQLIFDQKADAISGIYYWGYINCFDKIVKHSKLVARMELQPLFFLKEHKLNAKSDRVGHRSNSRPEANGKLPHIDDSFIIDDDDTIA